MNLRFKQNELFFFVGYVIYLTGVHLNITLFDAIPFFHFVNTATRYLIASLFFVVAIITGKPITRNCLTVFLLIFAFLLFNYFFSSDKATVMLLLIILAGRNIDFKKIMKVTLFVLIILNIFIFISSLIGIIDDRIYIQGVRIRHSFGFIYSNMPNKAFLTITMLLVYLRDRKISIAEIIVLLGINYWLFVLTTTRAAFLITAIVLIFALFFKYVKIGKFFSGMFSLFTPYSVVIAIFGIFLCSYYYGEFIVLDKLNDILTQRLQLGHEALGTYNLSLLGQSIPDFIGPEQIYVNPNLEYNYVDSAYLQMLLKNGILFISIICIEFALLGYKIIRQRDYYLAFMIIIIAVNAITEPQFLHINFNPFILYFITFLSTYDHKGVIHEQNWT